MLQQALLLQLSLHFTFQLCSIKYLWDSRFVSRLFHLLPTCFKGSNTEEPLLDIGNAVREGGSLAGGSNKWIYIVTCFNPLPVVF